MLLRNYRTEDCEEMADLFYNTVHTINAKDYTKKQLEVWATGTIDIAKWNQSFLEHNTIVALQEHRIVGFADMSPDGYLDRLYIHKDYQGKGIATALVHKLISQVHVDQIETHGSITARPFFESMGFKVVKKQQVKKAGIYLTNFHMIKPLLR